MALAGLDCKCVVGVLFVLSLAGGAASLGLPCKTEGETCSALVSFVPQADTNVSAITALFQLYSYRQLLGANAWELSVGENAPIRLGVAVKVPITCACNNATGISQDGPIYTVLPTNTLSIIAETVFGGLVEYPDIVKVNPKITDPNKIYAGDKYRIPLPCTCSAAAASSSSSSPPTIHYSYVVQAGNTLQDIASQMGTTESVLKTVNNITNSSLLAAAQLLDIPLKVSQESFYFTSFHKGTFRREFLHLRKEFSQEWMREVCNIGRTSLCQMIGHVSSSHEFRGDLWTFVPSSKILAELYPIRRSSATCQHLMNLGPTDMTKQLKNMSIQLSKRKCCYPSGI